MADEWVPRETPSSLVFVGVDPPGGWCIWGADGVIAFGQHREVLRATEDLSRAIRGRHLHVGAIEEPYPRLNEEHKNLASIITNAMTAGYWQRHLSFGMRCWTPLANEWRRPLGIPSDRSLAKRHAIKLAESICDLQGIDRPVGPRGGVMEHASEAICIALSAWLVFGMTSRGDMSNRIIDHLRIPYRGGKEPLMAKTIKGNRMSPRLPYYVSLDSIDQQIQRRKHEGENSQRQEREGSVNGDDA